jgi:uncharacterized membrane protein required for colicin V production
LTPAGFYGKLKSSDAEVNVLQQFLNRINWIDIVVLIILIKTAYTGRKRGLAGEILTFAGTFLVFFLSLTYYDRLARALAVRTPIPHPAAKPICLLFLLIVLFIVIRALFRYLEKLGKLVIMPSLDKYGGLVLGVCRGLIIGSLFIVVLKTLPVDYIQKSVEERSFSARYVEKAGTVLYRTLRRG